MKNKIVQLFLLLGLFGVSCYGFILHDQNTLEPTGMAKPIADLRDYNGTYDGSFGTGSIGYGNGTLYRDNQDAGRTSDCVGEGCGKHPGVDIPVPTGTKVYSATWSQVVISRCDDSWGGLIVLRGRNPWNGETLFFTYAHLSELAYSNGSPVVEGHWVSTGVQIGKTGGNPKNKCSGNSTGPHLHFQIDRDDGNSEPWYPPQSQLNRRDDNHQVNVQTYNPIVFLTGGYRWTFARNGDRELWDLFNIQSWGVNNGALWVDAGMDPYIRRRGNTDCGRGKPCSSSIAAEASLYRNVFLDLYNHCNSGAGKVYFTTNTSPDWSESKSVPYTAYYGAQQVHVPMYSNYLWNGIVTGLRVDPAQNCSSGWDPTYYGEITIER